MSFFGHFYKNDELSENNKVHFDLARKYYDNEVYEKALNELLLIESEERKKESVEVLHQAILFELEKVFRHNNTLTEDLEVKNESGHTIITKTKSLYESKVQNLLTDQYRVEHVNFDHEWIFVLSKKAGKEYKQRYLIVDSFNEDTFTTNVEQNFFISSAASDGETWFFVLEEKSSWKDQYWILSPNEVPLNELRQWQNEKLLINLFFESNDMYFASSVQPKKKLSDHILIQSNKDFITVLEEEWEQKNWINQIFVINSEVFYNTTKNQKIKNQSALVNDTFPEEELKAKLDENKTIKFLHFNNGKWFLLTESYQEIDNRIIEEDLSNPIKELNALIGLKEVKKEVFQLIDYLKIGKLKASSGMKTGKLNLHMIFSGNPGTGKTTVARLLGHILRNMGLLTKGHIVEVDRSGLVGQYIGETAQKTQLRLNEAKGGILFVDEAYALYDEGNGDFGKEAIETIIKRMEDDREDLVVIFAGYPKEMDNLLDSNPGIQSRFATHLYFADFSAEELMLILKKMLVKSAHFLNTEAEERTQKYLNYLAETANRYFGNAREMRNLFEDLVKNQSSRLAKQIPDLENQDNEDWQHKLREISVPDLIGSYNFNYQEKEEENLDSILEELNELIGLQNIKKEIEELAHYLKVLKLRNKKGLTDEIPGMHAIFIGNPGTGKTTVARLLARIYKKLGILKKGHFTEVSRQDLVAEYIGQTAIKTNKVIDKALHGVLFIDEAYSLSSNIENDFGKEALEVIVKRMEDDRDKLIVIMAGYPEPIQKLLQSNPGLPSRFNRNFLFPDFNEQQLLEIFLNFVRKSSYDLNPSVFPLLENKIQEEFKSRDEYFGNARWIRKFFEATKIAQAQRLNVDSIISEEELKQLNESDIKQAIVKLTPER
jgi:SpoVK/Ycf46/Vps4 family AAA+-type ATPase